MPPLFLSIPLVCIQASASFKNLLTVALIVAGFGMTMFPLWPASIKVVIWYLISAAPPGRLGLCTSHLPPSFLNFSMS
jgi:hypothetical protein